MDRMTKTARSATMSRIRGRGNRSTERVLRLALVRAGISGWRLHPAYVFGRPDFWFDSPKLAIFVDGCFWHSCTRCRIPIPASNNDYWSAKLAMNRTRDRGVTRSLRAKGVRVLRIWEHELATSRCRKCVLVRVISVLNHCGPNSEQCR